VSKCVLVLKNPEERGLIGYSSCIFKDGIKRILQKQTGGVAGSAVTISRLL
jgi:hypothetical protein